MAKYIVFVFLLTSSLSGLAQMNESAFHVGWNVLAPISDKEFTGKTSAAGIRVGFSKFMNDRFSFGIEGGYNTLNDYVPLRTYEVPGGAISTDVYNYLYYFTILANAQYYFTHGNKFTPYASLGMGMSFSEYRIFYNVFEDTNNQQSFVIRPEVGTLFRAKEYSRWGLKASISYDYATNKSNYFDVDNFSGISFQLGVVLFSE